jgi:hypothetical protein
MSSSTFHRVYIEVVTREDLETPLSIENMLFQLCERLHQQTALVQLHLVDRTESLGQLASGPDLIPSEARIEARTLDFSPFRGHATNLYFACSNLDVDNELLRRD